MSHACNAAAREPNWWDELPQDLIHHPSFPNTITARLRCAADAVTLCRLTAGNHLEQSVARMLSYVADRLASFAQTPEQRLPEHAIHAIRAALDTFDWRNLEPQSWVHIKRCDRELAAAAESLSAKVKD